MLNSFISYTYHVIYCVQGWQVSAMHGLNHRYITNRCQISANMGSIFSQTGKGKSY